MGQKNKVLILGILAVILSSALAWIPITFSIHVFGAEKGITDVEHEWAPPEWEEIIKLAFQILGIADYTIYPPLEGISAAGADPSTGLWVSMFIDPFPSPGIGLNGKETQDTTFHSYPAMLITSQYNGEDIGKYLWWGADERYFMVQISTGNPPLPAGWDALMRVAEALYEASLESFGSSLSVPSEPQNNPSEPEDLPSEPDNFPGDLCMAVNCKNNYCSDDGTKFLYDCTCNSEDGKCYCDSTPCAGGCDDALGGCIMQASGDPNDMCGGVDCGPDYCLDDGKTRMYDCKCASDDGECYCYNEVCEAGCNMATGRCVESMVIADQGGDDNEYIYYDNSPDLLDTLGVIGGVAAGGGVLIGGGYFAYKGVQGVLARQALKKTGGAAVKAAAQASDLSISELIANMEESMNRFSNDLDMEERALKPHELNYRDIVERNVKSDAQWAKTMSKRAALIEKAEFGVKAIKKGADIGAELVGNVPGVGNVYKYGYNLTTTAVESAAGGDSLGTVVLKTSSKGVETLVGDKLFGKVTNLDKMATDTVRKTVKQVIKDTGAEQIVVEGVKNEGLNNFMNVIKEAKSRSPFGGVEKRVETVANRIDRKGIRRMVKRVLYSR